MSQDFIPVFYLFHQWVNSRPVSIYVPRLSMLFAGEYPGTRITRLWEIQRFFAAKKKKNGINLKILLLQPGFQHK